MLNWSSNLLRVSSKPAPRLEFHLPPPPAAHARWRFTRPLMISYHATLHVAQPCNLPLPNRYPLALRLRTKKIPPCGGGSIHLLAFALVSIAGHSTPQGHDDQHRGGGLKASRNPSPRGQQGERAWRPEAEMSKCASRSRYTILHLQNRKLPSQGSWMRLLKPVTTSSVLGGRAGV